MVLLLRQAWTLLNPVLGVGVEGAEKEKGRHVNLVYSPASPSRLSSPFVMSFLNEQHHLIEDGTRSVSLRSSGHLEGFNFLPKLRFFHLPLAHSTGTRIESDLCNQNVM